MKIIFAALTFLLIAVHRILFSGRDGFYDTGSNYDALRRRLQSDLGDYCKLSDFIRDQVTEMQQGLKAVSSSLPSADDIKAIASSPLALKTQSLMAAGKVDGWYNYNNPEFTGMYKEVYMCKDKLASSRQSCGSPNLKMNYTPCSVYMDLPSWGEESTVMKALAQIKDDLAERLVREGDWFEAVMKKIQTGLDAGANPQAGDNPPGVAPTVDQMDKFKKDNEGFTCSPDAMALLRQKQLEKELKSCTPITANSEIDRINALLDNPSIRASVERMRRLYEIAKKLQSDLDKLKNGSLYDWQKDGAKKSYPFCGGKNRFEALVCSLKNMLP